MEVTVKAYVEEDDKPYTVGAPDTVTGTPGLVSAILNLRLINHRSDRPERIIGCQAELKKRHLFFWRRTLAVIQVDTPSSTLLGVSVPINNIFLEPMGEPQTLVIHIHGPLENIKMPRRSELVLVFQMVGPMRKYTYKLTDVLHNPKQVADKIGSQN